MTLEGVIFLDHSDTRSTARVSVIVVHYATPALLDNCLAALAASAGDIPLGVIVIDNGSPGFDGSAFRQRHPQVQLIANDTNRGFAAACNQGLRIAQGEFVLLLNPDAAVSPETIATMVQLMGEMPDVGCATARLVLPDGSLDRACRRSFPTPARAFFRLTQLSRLFPRSRLFGQYNLTYLDQGEDAEIDSPSGAFMFVRRSVVDQVGPLDETYFMYGEDLDWAFRIKAAGWRILYTARTSVAHQKRASSSQDRPRSIRNFHEAMRIFYRQHYQSLYPRPLAWLVYAAISFHEGAELIAERLLPQTKRVAQPTIVAPGASAS